MCSKNVKERLYLTLVRPHHEYGVAAWSPHQIGHWHQSSIEKVQRRAARFVQRDYARTSSVSSILSTLGWEKLAYRREAHQVTQLYKITNNDIDVDATHYLQPKNQRSRRGNNKQFVIPQASSYAIPKFIFSKNN